MSRKIAFLDFDGTITYKDTFLEFIRFVKGDLAFYMGFLLYSPAMVAFKLNIITNQKAKELIMRHFFAKMTRQEFDDHSERFAKEVIPSLIRDKALVEIEKLKEEGAKIVIVSASAENWVGKWSQALGLDYIATRLQCKNENISGKILGRNCYGEEKVERIKAEYDLSHFEKIYCYGDTEGDKPMLALAHIRFYKPFR